MYQPINIVSFRRGGNILTLNKAARGVGCFKKTLNSELSFRVIITILTEAEFKEFEPRLKSAKNRFQLIAGLNLEKFNTILSGSNHF